MESSLKALIFEVDGTCGPRQKSMNCGPSVYSENTSPARSWISSHFIQASAYLRRPSCFGVRTRSYGRSRAWISHMRFSIFQVFGRKRRGAVEIVVETG